MSQGLLSHSTEFNLGKSGTCFYEREYSKDDGQSFFKEVTLEGSALAEQRNSPAILEKESYHIGRGPYNKVQKAAFRS